VVPSLFAVTARWVVLDADLVVHPAIELRVEVGLEHGLEDAELGGLLAAEAVGIVQHLAVAVAQDVRGEPALDAEHPRAEAGRDQRLHERLTGLEVLAGDRDAPLARELA